MSDTLPGLLGYRGDAERRRATGAYGAQTYDVQNSGPSVMDTLGLIGFMSPYGLIGNAARGPSAEFAKELGSAAAKGADWVKARMFMDAKGPAAVTDMYGARWLDNGRGFPWAPPKATDPTTVQRGIYDPQVPIRAGQPGFAYFPIKPGAIPSEMSELSKGFNGLRHISKNDDAPLGLGAQQYYNAMLRQRRPNLDVIPGGR